ncbi:DUF4349 domain-containing protein [Nanoarchaeota archaeon]
MKKYLKWTLVAFAIFALLFAVGCAKSVLEGDDWEYNKGSSGVMVSTASQAVAVDYDTGADYEMEESYAMGASEPTMYRKGYMPPYYDNNHYGDGDDVDTETQIIRTGNIRLEVDDFFIASQKVEMFAKKYSGFVSSSHGSSYKNQKSGSVTIRVPEIHFDAVLAELSLLGEIRSKNINGQDVTEQYIDLQARVNNSQVQEKRLLEMYENASNVNQMMQVERELSRVRENVERMEGQLRYLKNRVAMSSVTVSLYEPVPVVKEWGIWRSVKNALNHSLSTFRWMIELIGWLLPLIVLGVLIGLLVRFLRRQKRPTLRKR